MAAASGTNAASSEEERARLIKEAAAYWDAHKARLRQLLAVDYPAAVARRNAATPEFPAVEAVAKALQKDFENRLEKDRPEDFPLQNFLDSHLNTLWLSRMLGRDLNDLTLVADGLTVADLTRQMLTDPKMLADARDGFSEAEWKVFHDEEAAQRVAAIRTGDELMAYVVETQTRYDAAIAQELDAIGGAAATRAFLTGLSDPMAVMVPVSSFLTSHSQAVDALLTEYGDAERSINPKVLAEMSGEDAEARRLLTEWKELQTLRQTNVGKE